MKKKYLLIIATIVITFSTNAQTCPTEIQASQSSSTAVRFKIASGTCNSYPSTITIDSSSFTQSSCNGTNLNYSIDSGQTPIDINNFTADFGNGVECTYVGSVLGITELDLYIDEISIHPNPLNKNEQLEIRLSQANNGNVSVYNLLGKVILNQVINNSKTVIIDPNNLNAGIYLLKIDLDNKTITKKIVVK